MPPTPFEIAASVCFAAAVVHTFFVSRFQRIARTHYRPGSFGENLFHVLGEVELVFVIWAGLLLVVSMGLLGARESLEFLERRSFTEPMFVFAIMAVCATRPVLGLASAVISRIAGWVPVRSDFGFLLVALVVGPLLGSFITEPAAMTVTALVLLPRFFRDDRPLEFKYAVLGTLFVNISVGGTLTPYAAPPVLMVAGPWNWDLSFMLANFGWRGALACLVSAAVLLFRYRAFARPVGGDERDAAARQVPWWLTAVHLAFLSGVVVGAHHPVVFLGLFAIFVGVVSATKEYQSKLRLREGLLVAGFLAGLVVLGAPQVWWLEPLLRSLTGSVLYVSAAALTAVIDNAAITYLGAQVPSLAEDAKYFLVAGSVVGGGLTVIANAPNPVGASILGQALDADGIAPLALLRAALVPTLIALVLFWL